MRDGPLLRAFKRLVLWHSLANLRVHRLLLRARGERPWSLGGDCRRCASCCEAPAISVGRLTWSLPIARRVFLAWQRKVNGFVLVRPDPEAQAFVFRCTHFDAATRSCDSYESRPAACRDYPRHLLWQPSPELLPRCGYRAMPPNAAGLRRALERIDLTAGQREKLRRGLRLDG